MRKRSAKDIIISILIGIFITTIAFYFFTSPTFRYFYYSYESLLVRELSLPEDKWKWEGEVLSSRGHKLVNPDIIKIQGKYRMCVHETEEDYVAVSSDGLDWELIEEPVFCGQVIQLLDGGYRMYLDGGPFRNRCIGAMISEDGINFEVEGLTNLKPEEGEFSNIKEYIGHPFFVKVEDGYRVYFDGKISAPKDDSPESKWVKMTVVDGKCELLYGDNKYHIMEIHSAFSEDGLNWTYEGLRIGFNHKPIPNLVMSTSPAVIKVGDEYRMYFAPRLFKGIYTVSGDVDNCRYEEHFDELYLATSHDGLDFTIVKRANVLGIDPVIISEGDKLRLYTWSNNKIYSYTQEIE